MQKIINRTGTKFVNTLMHLALDLDIQIQEDIPAGGRIIAANHPTTADPFYILTLVREPMYILITEMAFKAPILGDYLRAAGHIPVLVNNPHAAFDTAVEMLKDEASIGIFPEGTLSPADGGLHRPRTGAVRMALSAGVPIVPVGIYLDRQRITYVDTTCGDMSEIARWYTHGPYAMTVGRAISLTGDMDNHEYVRSASSNLLTVIGRLAVESARRIGEAHGSETLTLDLKKFAIPGTAC